jgi:hypothetical protein
MDWTVIKHELLLCGWHLIEQSCIPVLSLASAGAGPGAGAPSPPRRPPPPRPPRPPGPRAPGSSASCYRSGHWAAILRYETLPTGDPHAGRRRRAGPPGFSPGGSEGRRGGGGFRAGLQGTSGAGHWGLPICRGKGKKGGEKRFSGRRRLGPELGHGREAGVGRRHGAEERESHLLRVITITHRRARARVASGSRTCRPRSP